MTLEKAKKITKLKNMCINDNKNVYSIYANIKWFQLKRLPYKKYSILSIYKMNSPYYFIFIYKFTLFIFHFPNLNYFRKLNFNLLLTVLLVLLYLSSRLKDLSLIFQLSHFEIVQINFELLIKLSYLLILGL